MRGLDAEDSMDRRCQAGNEKENAGGAMSELLVVKKEKHTNHGIV
jgi:hypothetical protein